MWIRGYVVKNNKGWFQTISPTGVHKYTNNVKDAHMFGLLSDAKGEAKSGNGEIYKACIQIEDLPIDPEVDE